MGNTGMLAAGRFGRDLSITRRLPPHPGLLPQGEGTRFVADVACESDFHQSSRRFAVAAGKVSPSPRGRGQGEGERRTADRGRYRACGPFGDELMSAADRQFLNHKERKERRDQN